MLNIFNKLASILMLFMVTTLATANSLPSTAVSAEWLKDNLDNRDIRILDVSKKPASFVKGHIPNALSVHRKLDLGDTQAIPPNNYPGKKQFEELMQKLGITSKTTIVAYDDNKSMYATRLLSIMELYGHDPAKLKLLDGGWLNWASLEYPVEMGEAKMPKKTSYKVKATNLDRLVGSSDIYRDVVMKARPEIMLMDARPNAEFAARKIRSVRGGNIPGSINLTGENFMDAENHRLKPMSEIQQMLSDAGFSKDKEIYVYCHSGDRSAHVYWILTHMLGYDKVSINDSGWHGWANTTTYPAREEIWAWQKP